MTTIAAPAIPAAVENIGHRRRWTDRWVMAAMVIALALRAFRLGDAPLWFDETITAQWLADSWTEMIRHALGDNHPPVYFMIAKGWSEIFGSSPAALRMPSLIASLLCVPVIADSARIVGGRRAMRWAAWLSACAPLLVHHAQEARPYALIALFASIHFWMLLGFLYGEKPRLGTSFAIVGALLVWSHYYGAAFVFGEVAVLVMCAANSWRTWAGSAAFACGAALAAGCAAVFLAHHEAGGGYHFGVVAIAGVMWALITEYSLLPSSADLHAGGAAAAARFVPLALFAAVCLAPVVWWGFAQLGTRARIAAALVLTSVIGAPYAVSLILNVGLHPRYAIPALPALLVLCATAAQERRHGAWPRYALSGVIAVMAVASARHLLEPSHGREDVRSAGQWLDGHVGSRGQILVTSDEMAQLARFHWPERAMRVYPPPRLTVTEENAGAIAAAMPVSPIGETFYVIGREWVSDPNGLLMAELQQRYSNCEGTTVRGIRILCLRADRANSSTFNIALEAR